LGLLTKKRENAGQAENGAGHTILRRSPEPDWPQSQAQPGKRKKIAAFCGDVEKACL
jgi:hypothetical protein